MYWTIYLEGGPQRVNHAAVAIGTNIYSLGGYSSSEGYEVLGKIDIYVLNTVTLRWTYLNYFSSGDEVPFKRYGHTVVAYGRKIYLWGGRNNYTASNILHCFDIDDLTWSICDTTGRPPLSADGHSACVINDYMYIFSGFQEDTENFGKNVYRISLNLFEWEEVETYGTPPKSRDFHTASAIGDRMYIFGGRSAVDDVINDQNKSEFYCNKIMYLNTKTMTWVTPDHLGFPPCGRRSHSAIVYKDELYIIGGYNGTTQTHLNDVYKFDPARNIWTKMACMGEGPCPRRRHCSVLVGKEMFLFGGSSHRSEEEKILEAESDSQKLIDHSDLYVLDFFPSLKRLCQLRIISNRICVKYLPKSLIQELNYLTTDNIVTRNEFYPRKDYGIFSFSA